MTSFDIAFSWVRTAPRPIGLASTKIVVGLSESKYACVVLVDSAALSLSNDCCSTLPHSQGNPSRVSFLNGRVIVAKSLMNREQNAAELSKLRTSLTLFGAFTLLSASTFLGSSDTPSPLKTGPKSSILGTRIKHFGTFTVSWFSFNRCKTLISLSSCCA